MYSGGQWINLIAREWFRGKADSLHDLEGSRPECAKASVQVTTGV